jgi:hypothetical protein
MSDANIIRRLEERREQYKGGLLDPDRRRKKLLARQHERRAERCADLLARVVDTSDADDDSDAGADAAVTTASSIIPDAAAAIPAAAAPAARSKRAMRSEANQLQIPEFMTSIPADLNGCAAAGPGGGFGVLGGSSMEAEELAGGGWLVLPRPAGVHCIVVAKRAQTTARDAEGSLMARFQSSLQPPPSGPAGGGRSGGGSGFGFGRFGSAGGDGMASGGPRGHTVVECIFDEGSGTFHVLDVLVWGGTPCFEWPLEMRRFWLASHLPETGAAAVVVPPGWPRALVQTPPSADRLLDVVAAGGASISSAAAAGIGTLPSPQRSVLSPRIQALLAAATSTSAASGAGATVFSAAAAPTFQHTAASAAAGASAALGRPVNEYSFVLAASFECDLSGLRIAYETACAPSQASAARPALSTMAQAASGYSPPRLPTGPLEYVSRGLCTQVGGT